MISKWKKVKKYEDEKHLSKLIQLEKDCEVKGLHACPCKAISRNEGI